MSATETPAMIPAVHGWVARLLWLDTDTDTVQAEYLPVVAWSLGGEDHFDWAPLIWLPDEHTLGTAEDLYGDYPNGMIDAVFFDPDRIPGEPERQEHSLRAQIARRTKAAD